MYHLRIKRNVAYNIIGHAYYLESGVEENNELFYNLASFVHTLGGPALMVGSTEPAWEAYDNLKVPSDRTASGFYV